MCCVSVKSNLQNYCLPLPTIAQSSEDQSTPEPMQGRPGKTGPVGPPGPVGLKGEQGSPGECACDPSEIEELRNEILRILRE